MENWKKETNLSSSSIAGGTLKKLKTLADFPVDYENKPIVSQALDPDNQESIVLQDVEGLEEEKLEVRQYFIAIEEGIPYVIVKPVSSSEDDNLYWILRIDYEKDAFYMEEDVEICDMVINDFKDALKSRSEGKELERSEFILDLYDTAIDEKTWKKFKKRASQEELAIIAIGAKYRLCHSRIKNIIYGLGIILSIALFWPTRFMSLIAYPIFAILATKTIRYQDTFNQSYSKLSPENKKFVNRYYNSNIWLRIVDSLLRFVTIWLTIPYQIIMIFIGFYAPNFVIAKNGVLVSIPKGYDIGGLGSVGSYYKSFKFIDEVKEKIDFDFKKEEYTFVNDFGCNQTVYVGKDGKTAYDSYGDVIGTVEKNGVEKKFIPKD